MGIKKGTNIPKPGGPDPLPEDECSGGTWDEKKCKKWRGWWPK